MNIVLFFAMWIQQCVGQVCIVCVPLEYQSYGVMMCVNQWTNPMGHVQRTNPMGTGGMLQGT